MTKNLMSETDPSQFKDLVEKGIPFTERMGMKILDMGPRRVSLMVPLEGNENHIDIMYAGAMFTIAEVPGGVLFMTTFDVSKYVPIVKGMNIRFVKPAATDVTFSIEMSQEEVDRINKVLEEKGKCDFVLEGEVKDAKGVVVAETTATYQIRNRDIM